MVTTEEYEFQHESLLQTQKKQKTQKKLVMTSMTKGKATSMKTIKGIFTQIIPLTFTN